MSALTPYVIADERHLGLTKNYIQKGTFWLEKGLVAQNDTIEYVMDRLESEEDAMVPVLVEIFTHDGGLTNTVDDTWNVDAGDTIIYEVSDPESGDLEFGKGPKHSIWRKFTHTLADTVTDGAVTKQELIASLNGDATFFKYAYADFDSVTAERVTLYPRNNLAQIRVVDGTAQAVILWSGTADNRERTYTHHPIVAADWSWTFDRGESKLVITRVNAASAKNVAVRVRQF